MIVTIARVAEVLKVHPRTVVRALAGDVKAEFSKTTNDQTTLAKLAKVYNSTAAIWAAAIAGTDKLIRQEEAAKMLGMVKRTFRQRRIVDDFEYGPDIEYGATLRYSERRILKLKKALAAE